MEAIKERKEYFEDIALRFAEVVETEKLYLNSRLTLDEVAARIGESRYHVSRAVNRYLGTGFYTYINELRLEEARRIIRENTENKFLSADDIAAASGFSGRCNYYRICKRMTGMSPDELKYSLTCKNRK